MKTTRMANVSTNHMPVQPEVSILNGFLQYLNNEKELVKLCPYHGGGGWHRLQSVSYGKLNYMFDEAETNAALHKTSFPVMKTEDGVNKLNSLKQINDFIDQAVRKESLHLIFPTLYEILSGTGGSYWERLGFVQLLSLRFYLWKRNGQWTPLWETGSYLFLSLLALNAFIPNLPKINLTDRAIKYKFFERVYDFIKTNLISMPAYEKQIINNGFELHMVNDIKNSNRSRMDVLLSQFRLPDNINIDSSNNNKKIDYILRNSRSFDLLVDIDTKTKKHDDGVKIVLSEGEKHDEKVFFQRLLSHELVKGFEAGKEYLNRVSKDVGKFDRQTNKPVFDYDLNQMADLAEAVSYLESELDQDQKEIDELLVSLFNDMDQAFPAIETAAKLAPILNLKDLMGMLCSKAGGKYCRKHGIPLHKVSKLLLLCTKMQLRGRVRLDIDGLIDSKNFKEQVPAVEELLLETLTIKRTHFDPRKLCFEFESGYTLRKTQCDLIDSYCQRALDGKSGCRQMKMGDGKSSTIFPLLGLLLTNGKRLTILTVPEPLIDMSHDMLIRALGHTFERRVTFFQFTRDTLPLDQEVALALVKRMYDNLLIAREICSVVLTTPTSLKAFVLKYVEEIEKNTHPNLIKLLCQIGQLFYDSTLLMDECDVLLHPLKSELNFPIGPKQDLAQSVWRVDIAIELLQNLFDDPESKDLIRKGLDELELQASPHIVLMDDNFYRKEIVSFLANRLGKWLSRKLALPDANLSKLHSTYITCKANSTRVVEGEEDHGIENILQEDNIFASNFWCSDEYPKQVEVLFNLQHKNIYQNLKEEETIGALGITFRPYSSFFFASGLSMLPSKIQIYLSHDKGKTYQLETSCTEFVERRIYIESNKRVSHLKLVLSGDSRWFSIQKVVFHSKPLRSKQEGPLDSKYLSNLILEEDDLENSGLTKQNKVILNLAKEYLSTYLPHCLGKTNSVSFGVVPDSLAEKPDANGFSQSSMRRFMAVPFVGKDTPSKASEFSHPDIIILLTLLSYRHGGLRLSDVMLLVQSLQRRLKSETGPILQREAFKIFDDIVNSGNVAEEQQYEILPLHLFQVEDDNAMKHLWKLIRFSTFAIHYFCKNITFPLCLQHRTYKLKATGEELLIVCNKGPALGMSGTPNAAIPLKLGECEWEDCTEGKFLRTLTRKEFVRVAPPLEQDECLPTVLLEKIASIPGINALIDCGAIVTDMSNEQVAIFLLEKLSFHQKQINGVVFLNQNDKKMIVYGDDKKIVPFESSPIPINQRFTFYDQVHTTGMDIKHSAFAKAVITLNKDTTFRDFAQGAWRMRRLGKGQSLIFLYPKTVEKLAMNEFESFHSDCQRMVAFLYLNTLQSMFSQQPLLERGHLSTIWRSKVWDNFMKFDKLIGDDDGKNVFRTKVTFDLDIERTKNLLLDSDDVLSLKDLTKKYSKYIKSKDEKKLVKRILSDQQSPKTLFHTFQKMKRRFWMLRRSLDAEQQQERSMNLNSEQQQEKEKEKQNQSMGDFETEQKRAWVGQKYEVSTWNFETIDNVVSKIQEISFEGETLNCDLDGILFTKNHTLKNPLPNSRLRNVEIVLRHRVSKHIIVVSFEEAASIRWALFANPKLQKANNYDLLLTEFNYPLTVTNTTTITTATTNNNITNDARIQIVRYFNVSHYFTKSEIDLIKKILEPYMSGHERHTFYLKSKAMRRREQLPGEEAKITSPLYNLFF